jgi:hypothetical protein
VRGSVTPVPGGHGLDLIAVAAGALVTLGVLLALAGTRLLLKRHTHTRRQGDRP